MVAGSSAVKSCWIGNRRVWSDARLGVGVAIRPSEHAATSKTATASATRARAALTIILMSVIGEGRRRLAGAGKATGVTRFTADLEVAGLLHVHLVLSHLASALIRSVDVSAAKAAPGVVDVITGADLPKLELAGQDMPLALQRVYYAGQPVAAVIAESEAAAADAAGLVEVDYEELPAVADSHAAMRDD